MPTLPESYKWHLAQRLEKRWWNRYLKKKEVDAYLAWKRNYWQSFLERIDHPALKSIQEPVLDAGCGPAGIFCYLHDQVESITAVDPLLQHYSGRIDHFDPTRYPNVRFVESIIESFQSEPFPTVFCLNAINHVSNLALAFEQLSKLTQPGGYCIISVDAHRWRFGRWFLRTVPLDALHPHQLNLKEYVALVEKVGFGVEHVTLLKRAAIFDYQVLVCRKK